MKRTELKITENTFMSNSVSDRVITEEDYISEPAGTKCVEIVTASEFRERVLKATRTVSCHLTERCLVCCERYNDHFRKPVTCVCSYVYCTDCYNKVVATANRCPACRKSYHGA